MFRNNLSVFHKLSVFFSQAKRALEKGATAVIFDVSKHPGATNVVSTVVPLYFLKCYALEIELKILQHTIH